MHSGGSTPLNSTGASKLDLSLDSPSIQVADVACACKNMAPITKSVTNLAKATSGASKSVLKWSQKDDNAAVRDVGKHLAELLQMTAEQHARWAHEHERAVQALRQMGDCDASVAKLRKRLDKLMAELGRLDRDIAKGVTTSFFRKGGDVRVMECRRDAVRDEISVVRTRLAEEEDEQQVVRMFRLRQALQLMGGAYTEHGTRIGDIHAATAELAECVPAISTQNLRTMNYAAQAHTREIMQRVRDNVGEPMACGSTDMLLHGYHRAVDTGRAASNANTTGRRARRSAPALPTQRSTGALDRRDAQRQSAREDTREQRRRSRRSRDSPSDDLSPPPLSATPTPYTAAAADDAHARARSPTAVRRVDRDLAPAGRHTPPPPYAEVATDTAHRHPTTPVSPCSPVCAHAVCTHCARAPLYPHLTPEH